MTHMRMLYDKKEGCFKVLDTKRYSIVDIDDRSGVIYVNHYKDGAMYTGTSPFVNSECSCIETFSKNGSEMQRIGLINFNTGYIILYTTKKVSKLKKAYTSIAKNLPFTKAEVALEGREALTFSSIAEVSDCMNSLKSSYYKGYFYIKLYCGEDRIAEDCFYKKENNIAFQTFTSSVSLDNTHVNEFLVLSGRYENGVGLWKHF